VADLSNSGDKASVRPTIFERHQRIVSFLREWQVARVAELAELLDVSEATIRSDLRALAADGQVRRVRGGAALPDQGRAHHTAFAARARINDRAKQQIARWAAGLIVDGDVIFLDASTTVYYLVPYLQDRRRLTVITNGLDVGYALARNPTNTVILLGGVLRPEACAVTGSLSQKQIADLHMKKAFVSCSGFSLEVGSTEVDLEEAHLKSRMVDGAEAIIALVDSSKFGKVGLSPSVRPERVSHLFTDDNVSPQSLERLQRLYPAISVCSKDTVTSLGWRNEGSTHYRIAFANLNEQQPFPIDVQRGLEQAAREAGNIELILADNQLSGEVAVEVARSLIAMGLDLVIEYQIDEQAGHRIMSGFRQAGIPVIAVDIPMLGATFFGVDNYRAGHMAGVALGNWVQRHWGGQFDRLLVLEEPRAGALPAARIRGQLDGLQEVVGHVPEARTVRLDSGNEATASEARMVDALDSLPDAHRLAVITFNDDAAVGALAAARRVGRESDVVVVGQGADRRGRAEMRRPGSRLIGSTAYRPENYGGQLIAIVQRILAGEPVPPAVCVDHPFITPENIDQYYPEDTGVYP